MSARDLTILGCSSQQQTRFRNQGAYLLRWNDEGLLFDPGEGTQRQFIHADVPPPCVTRIFISHFHGDHCLGLGSMLLRLNLDKVKHPIHCYYPASGKKFFDRLRYCCIYRENIEVIEHPVKEEGLVEDDGKFRIEAAFLDHGVENIGWRVTEPDTVKFHKDRLKLHGIEGPIMRDLEKNKKIVIDGKTILLEDVSYIRPGDAFSYVVDTRPCKAAVSIAKGAKMLICESTYLESERQMADDHKHMTAMQAAEIAKEAGVGTLILTHFSARYRDLAPFAEEARSIFPNTFVADDLLKFPFPR
jgi:ribonuclease Z